MASSQKPTSPTSAPKSAAPVLSVAEKTAFEAGWNARETGSAVHADGRESCAGMFARGFNFGDADTGEDLTRAAGVGRLIAAAPQLLEKLQRLVAACVEDFGTPDEDDEDDEPVGRGIDSEMAIKFGHIREALAAISKATGEPS